MVTGIIMASGFSKRMGEDKLLLEVEGIKVIERVIKACKESLLDDIILVYRLNEVKDIAQKYHIRTIYNPNAHMGQSASVIQGVSNAYDTDGFMFFVADQPYLCSEIIDILISEFNKDKNKIVTPYFNMEFGMPIIFPVRFRDDLLQVKGDKGGREIIANNSDLVKIIHFDNEKLGADIDTVDDYLSLINK
jgi:molybdenum cofactor cytidylyltransferase